MILETEYEERVKAGIRAAFKEAQIYKFFFSNS